MGILSTLKNVFLPDAQTAADRRQAVFGTTSKIPPIIAAGVAAAVVAVPVLRTAAIKTVIAHPVATVLGTAVVSGGGLKLVEPAFQATKKATEVAVPVLTGEDGISSKNIKEVAKTVGLIAGVGTLGVAAGIIGEKVLSSDKVTETEKALIASSDTGTILPATTTVSPSRASYRRRTAQKTPSVIQSVRINVINRPVTTGFRVTNKRYIKERIFN